jgi:hypothetical protein
MTRQIVIQGSLVTEQEIQTVRTVSLEDFLPRIERKTPMHLPQLPKPSAFHWGLTSGGVGTLILLIEVDPQIIDMSMYNEETFSVSIPYSRFLFSLQNRDPNDPLTWHMNDYRLFWAKTPYRDPDLADMQAAMLPNIYGDGRICFGSTAPDANTDLATRLNTIVNSFYMSHFNHDLQIRYPNGWRSNTAWVRMTENDPTAWTEWSDWTMTTRDHKSWTQLVTEHVGEVVTRLDPVIAADPIPPLPMGATWGRTEEWFQGLTPTQRLRLRQVLIAEDGVTDATT